MVMLRCFIKYSDISSKTLQVPFKMALSFGRYGVKAGITTGAGMILRFKMITTTNTKIEIAATKRNINLSVMFFEEEAGIKMQKSRFGIFYQSLQFFIYVFGLAS